MPEPDFFHANLQRGTLLLNQNRPKEVLPFIQAAISANTEAPEVYAELARCYNAIPDERAKAIDAINRAIGLAPNVSRYFGLKGWYLVCLLQFHAAMQVAQQGLAINPVCAQSLNSLANAYTKLGQWKNAEAACRRILALDPNDGPGLNLLAQAFRHQGRYKESRETVARLLANLPNNAFGHANAGYAALAAGDHLRANEHFLESLRLDPHFDLARRGLLESLRARVWFVRLNTRIASTLSRFGTPVQIRLLKVALCLIIVLFGPPLLLLLSDYSSRLAMGIFVLIVFPCVLYILLSFITNSMGTFLLLFHPIGRQALSPAERKNAWKMGGFALLGALSMSCLMPLFFPFLILVPLCIALSIQFPLLKDRWNRRRERKATESRS